ncbi:hypothetical protein [Tautonia rosea]|uniref:hypothetical protein n=1 Tax=Tautonia rosea TaxID=2728037 RepID=UPI0014740A4F|nr:hypothetical protein [Tautonia rosea]
MPPSPIGPESVGPGSSSDADRLLDLLAGLANEVSIEDLLDHPALDAVSDEQLDRAVRFGIANLASPRGAAALRLVEALGDPDLYDALADALLDQPDLAVDHLYQAIEVLEGTGRIEARPELFTLREELIEALDHDDASLEGLIDQIEEEPEDVWFALQGLAEIEPEVRAEIVTELGHGGAIGPGTAEVLRLLSYAHDPSLRRSAIEALEASGRLAEESDGEDVPHQHIWVDLAAHHPDPEVAARARRWLGGRGSSGRGLPALRSRPTIVASLVSGLDGRGRGQIALVAEEPDRDRRVGVAFACDVIGGVREVVGRIATIADPEPAESLLADLRARPDCDVVEGHHELALGLLAGALLLCGPETTPALRYWLERTIGPEVRPRPFAGLPIAEDDPIVDVPPPPFEEMPDRVAEVFNACPGWIDTSALTFELAEELLLRWDGAPPDPDRDAGAYRFLFEHRLREQLELYRRMLFWMAWFWRSAGATELARSALTLADQLSDPQHVVPAHPFTTALTSRSLAAAQQALRLGFDPRPSATRARLDQS